MLRRLKDFFVRPIASKEIEALYRACVAQARQPYFYAALNVPDSVDGRFDLLILHVILVIQRLSNHPAQTQQLFDILFADMDKNLREMGVSDISIAKKMKPMLAAFYGRAKIYEQALLAANDEPLYEALRRNIYSNAEIAPEIVDRLTSYVRSTYEMFKSQSADKIETGVLVFPTLN
jgi:cytochrome b pre-mRNA-processing protein 3